MSYTLEYRKDSSAVLMVLHADYDYATEMTKSTQEAMKLLDGLAKPAYYISDMSAVRFTLEQTIEGTNAAARGDNPLLHHRNIKQALMVVGDALQQMAVKGLTSETFGNTNIRIFATLQEALAYARAN